MTGAQLAIIIAGSLILGGPLIALMVKANRSERRSIERRRAEWIANGADPDEEPNFFSGSGGGSSGSS